MNLNVFKLRMPLKIKILICMSFCMKDHTGLMLYTKRMMNGGCLMTKSIGRWLVGCGLIQKTFMNINIYGKIY